MRIAAAVSLIACLVVWPVPASAHARFRVAPATLEPGSGVVIEGSGLPRRARVNVHLALGSARLAVASARASRSGHVRLTVPYTAAVARAVSGQVGLVAGTLLVRGHRLPVHVLGVVLDRMALTVVPAGPVGYDDDLTLEATGIRAGGPPVAIRFRDCLGAAHAVRVARPGGGGPVRVVLPAHVGGRIAVDTTCFGLLGLEYAPIAFTIGETVGGAFRRVTDATASFLPPIGV